MSKKSKTIGTDHVINKLVGAYCKWCSKGGYDPARDDDVYEILERKNNRRNLWIHLVCGTLIDDCYVGHVEHLDECKK